MKVYSYSRTTYSYASVERGTIPIYKKGTRKMIAAMLAVDEGGAIGNKGELPWPRLSEDMKWFRETTKNSMVVMGRKTWDSLPSRPLPNRVSIVVSRSNEKPHGYDQSKVTFLGDNWKKWLMAIEKAQTRFITESSPKFIIGGAEIYRQAFDICDTIYLTTVYGKHEADTYMPNLDLVLSDFFLSETPHEYEKCKMEIWHREKDDTGSGLSS